MVRNSVVKKPVMAGGDEYVWMVVAAESSKVDVIAEYLQRARREKE